MRTRSKVRRAIGATGGGPEDRSRPGPAGPRGRRGGADALYGGTGDNSLFGNKGNDYLFGNAGRDLIDGGSNIPSFTINFPSPVDAFGARYEAVNAPPALSAEIDGETVDISALINAQGYVGITSNTAFSSVTFFHANPNGLESFRMDDVTFGVRIPTPASAALLGLGGLAAARRRR